MGQRLSLLIGISASDSGDVPRSTAASPKEQHPEIQRIVIIIRDSEGNARDLSKGWKADVLSEEPMAQTDAWRMIRRRAKAAGIEAPIGCHTFRATGITAYLENCGTLEHAQAMAAHESPRTTKLYDRTRERLTLDEIERIRL
jgi:integrase